MNSTTGSPVVTDKKAAIGHKNLTATKVLWRRMFVLALVGGLAFWLTNFAISRTAIAAEYRAALSISYYPMLLEALVGGLIIGLLVSFLLLRFYNRIPAKDPIIKSLLLSFFVLLVVTNTIGNPLTFNRSPDAARYFIISTIFNFFRIFALGFAIGYGRKIQNSNLMKR